MRAVVQRVSHAEVAVDGQIVGQIEKGLMVLIGIHNDDTDADLEYIFQKVTGMRIFEDENGKLNKALADIGGSILAISQFTLQGDARKGRRPSFTEAAGSEKAKPMYDEFIKKCIDAGINTQKGIFGADMKVELCNDGPVTILLDSKKLF